MVTVDRIFKPALFAALFIALAIAVAGIPIQITRTYDSRNKAAGDFGTGWTLDLLNIQLQKNRHPGRAWDQSVLSRITFPNRRVSAARHQSAFSHKGATLLR